jgi:hypothetical protein
LDIRNKDMIYRIHYLIDGSRVDIKRVEASDEKEASDFAKKLVGVYIEPMEGGEALHNPIPDEELQSILEENGLTPE